ncbi:ureidoglycolate hydrolase [Hahella sp. CCB-MM4]|uniref:ureidoglycolate lyase n=1 Tax=Hahella sp. (strain CCB-MM4) TaxID=1926491 RepID=UPI000B9B863B|nr:ureidoglycolate lyase [Hahella sp. CCB-MM4]OZG70263.1 ureidoglycolate hydrolase [Hahella sp. CCB-MM4]
MAVLSLKPEPLTAEAFSPFGQVLEISDQQPLLINDGNTLRYDSLAPVELSGPDDYGVMNLFRARPRDLPMPIKMVERHPLGSQAFIPLSGEPYLVLVALPKAGESDNIPDPESLRLFFARQDQGVNYARNTWHHPVLGLNKTCDFLVVDRKGPGSNCIEHYFDESLEISIDMNEAATS